MGTRHFIGVVKDGDFKIAQYGQWDGYPSGQGATALKFAQDADNISKLRAAVDAVRFVTEDDYKEAYRSIGIPEDSGFMNMDQADLFSRQFPGLTRDTGAGILSLVAEGTVTVVGDAREFPHDSLFCEYAYVIDLDAGTFEAYVGFQHVEHRDGRWAGKVSKKDFEPGYVGQPFYAPVRLAATWTLDALPEQAAFEAVIDSVELYYRQSADGKRHTTDKETGIVPVKGPVIVTSEVVPSL